MVSDNAENKICNKHDKITKARDSNGTPLIRTPDGLLLLSNWNTRMLKI
jgi:hypothetical protein